MPFRFYSAASLTAATALVAFTAPAMPAAAQGTRLTESAGGFSYAVPAGWVISRIPGNPYKVCYRLQTNDLPPNIIERVQPNSDSLAKFTQDTVADLAKQTKRFHILSQTPFVTALGLHGMRVAMDGTLEARRAYQIYYIFPKPSSQKVGVLFTCLEADSPKYVPTADSAMKTFTLP